jgi:hypothetical protein
MSTPLTQIIVTGGEAFKICCKCGEPRELREFSPHGGRAFGLSSRCKPCEATRTAKWRSRNVTRYRTYCRNFGRTIEGGFYYLRHQAKKRELECDFTLDSYKEIMTPNRCHYCEGPLNETGAKLDRKDSALGYLVANCVPCCLKCNLIRGEDNVSYAEMLEVAKLLKRLRGPKDLGVERTATFRHLTAEESII